MPLALTVTKPSLFASEWNIERKGKVIGTLRMIKKFSYMLAEAETPAGVFHMGYKGISTSNLFIRDESGTDVASFQHLSWWKKDMILTLGKKEYLWKQCNFWGTSYAWYSADGSKEILRICQRGLWKNTATIELEARTVSNDQVLLMLFGLYQMKLVAVEAASMSGVVVASGVTVS